ncbi:phosphatidate cytidylyltransferase [Vibrio marisflavi]|uniref:Phosphatidate cytidylyltransferase n=1 Tax=Vibrio marisflavi CECT 7928 TaxID=634439 RepID=A0ABN8E5T7_9VIBR|nr:phosphatidate cytidylyltransferase [Vibrio marisflavi]CAH0540979.1 Phosphatidate cytidylyltransferase [Vibrio marisflavi CECT 7928]
MKQRIITALILAPLVIWGIFDLPLPWFVVAMAGVVGIGFWEWTQFVNNRSRMIALVPALIVGAVSLYFVPFDHASLNQHLPEYYAILIAGAIWWVCSSLLAVTYPKSRSVWESSNCARHLFGILTLLPFFWSVLLLRAEGWLDNPFHGAKIVLFVCLIVWAADTGAYFTGKSLGKHKMAPHVSPNKTIEGLIGGIVTAIVVAWLSAKWFHVEFKSPVAMILITLLTVVFAVLGDLVESMFKRVSGVKDSSNIIPGHGGVLDRIDSLTAAFPIFALLYLLQ